jgi:hypothetical protein
MQMRELKLKGKKRWEVLFREGNWLVGLYCPERASREEVQELEKHDFPELFYLVDGEVTLLVGEKVKEVKLTRDRAVVVEDWHNAYGKGKVLVVEREGVKTEFRPLRKTS